MRQELKAALKAIDGEIARLQRARDSIAEMLRETAQASLPKAAGPKAAKRKRARRGENQARVLKAMSRSAMALKDISKKSGVVSPVISLTLAALVKAGKAVRVGRGRYKLAG